MALVLWGSDIIEERPCFKAEWQRIGMTSLQPAAVQLSVIFDRSCAFSGALCLGSWVRAFVLETG